MELIATDKARRYGVRRLKAGDVFEATARDAELLILLGQAVERPVESVVKPAPRKSKKAETEKPSRTYQRRDLKAED